MAFNYARERKKFEKEWKRLRSKYTAAGMSLEDIEAMRQFDLDVFNSNRRFFSHTQPLLSSDCGEDDYGQEDKSVLLVRFSEAMSVTDDGVSFHSRYWWIEELDMSCVWLNYMVQYFQYKNCVGSSLKTKKCVASFLVPGDIIDKPVSKIK